MNEKNTIDFAFNGAPTQQYAVVQHSGQDIIAAEDVVAEEVPIALVYNGVSHAVMLATPEDLEDFAMGFSLSEGIIQSAADIYSVGVEQEKNGIALQIDVASQCFHQLKEKRRNMTGRTGCGLCGSDRLAQALRLPTESQPLIEQAGFTVKAAVLSKSVQAMREVQALQASTGATHASALIDNKGNVLLCREDVGRHNALDKLVGAIQKQSTKIEATFVLTSSRASYEMVQKTISAGVAMLVAVSAPTGLAIRMAQYYGLTLVGFTRESRFVVYADQKQIIKQ